MIEKVTITASISGFFTFLLGPLDGVLIGLMVALVLDQITGVLRAIYEKKLSSFEGIKGFVKTALTLVVVMVAQVADRTLGFGGVLHEFIVIALIANEGISVLVNAAACGIPIPQRLLDVLEAAKGEKKDKKEEKKTEE